MKRILKFLAILSLVTTMTSCKSPSGYILVTSATTIGFDVSESTATQTPQATLAYKRAELVIVPCPTNAPVPDVIMSFMFKTSLFSSDGGIYSRIATGPNATTSAAATLLAAKNSDGNISSNITINIPFLAKPPK